MSVFLGVRHADKKLHVNPEHFKVASQSVFPSEDGFVTIDTNILPESAATAQELMDAISFPKSCRTNLKELDDVIAAETLALYLDPDCFNKPNALRAALTARALVLCLVRGGPSNAEHKMSIVHHVRKFAPGGHPNLEMDGHEAVENVILLSWFEPEENIALSKWRWLVPLAVQYLASHEKPKDALQNVLNDLHSIMMKSAKPEGSQACYDFLLQEVAKIQGSVQQRSKLEEKIKKGKDQITELRRIGRLRNEWWVDESTHQYIDKNMSKITSTISRYEQEIQKEEEKITAYSSSYGGGVLQQERLNTSEDFFFSDEDDTGSSDMD
jgi:hypothetical protein